MLEKALQHNIDLRGVENPLRGKDRLRPRAVLLSKIVMGSDPLSVKGAISILHAFLTPELLCDFRTPNGWKLAIKAYRHKLSQLPNGGSLRVQLSSHLSDRMNYLWRWRPVAEDYRIDETHNGPNMVHSRVGWRLYWMPQA